MFSVGYIFEGELKRLTSMGLDMAVCGKEKDQICQKSVAQTTGCLEVPLPDAVKARGGE